MKSQSLHSQRLVMGLIAGGLIGAGAALILTPKSGKQLRRHLSDVCQNLAETTDEIKESLLQRGEEFIDSAQEWTKSPQSPSTISLAIGGITGCALGATIAILISHQNEKTCTNPRNHFKEASRFSHDIGLKAQTWISNAKSFVDTMHDVLHTEEAESKPTSGSSPIHEILELASLGARLFQNFKNRR